MSNDAAGTDVVLQTNLGNMMVFFDVAYSPCQKYLAACNIFGSIYIWNLKNAFEHNSLQHFQQSQQLQQKLFPQYCDLNDDGSLNYSDDIDMISQQTKLLNHSLNANNTNTNKKREQSELLDLLQQQKELKDKHHNFTQINKYHSDYHFKVPFPKSKHGLPLYSMETIDERLFVGTDMELVIFDWHEIIGYTRATMNARQKQQKTQIHLKVTPQVLATYQAPRMKFYGDSQSKCVEINDIVYNENTNSVYLGTGSPTIYEYDLHKQTLKSELQSHKDYILDLALTEQYLASASNDATTKIWDVRNFGQKQQCVATFNVATAEKVKNNNDNNNNMPKQGNCLGITEYASCVDIHCNNRYLITGSAEAKHLLLFELAMQKCITVMPSYCIPQSVLFVNNNNNDINLVAGYNDMYFRFWQRDCNHIKTNNRNNYNNMIDHCIPTNQHSIWNIAQTNYNHNQQITAVCGASHTIDLIYQQQNLAMTLHL